MYRVANLSQADDGSISFSARQAEFNREFEALLQALAHGKISREDYIVKVRVLQHRLKIQNPAYDAG